MSVREEAAAFHERLGRIDALLADVEATANPALKTCTEELLTAVMELHGTGLRRMLEVVWASGPAGEALIHGPLAQDPLAGGLLLLHGLHPLPLEARVEQALDKARPYLASHGGGVELVGVEDGVVRLRLQGTCGSCPASSVTLRFAVEDAIYEAAPDVMAVEAVSDEQAVAAGEAFPGFIPLEMANGHAAAGGDGAWHDVGDLTALAPRTPEARDVEGRSVLFLRLGEHLYAYGNACPDCQAPLEAAPLAGTVLACPACGLSYDAIRAGRGLDKPMQSLEPFPLLVEHDHVRIALPG